MFDVEYKHYAFTTLPQAQLSTVNRNVFFFFLYFSSFLSLFQLKTVGGSLSHVLVFALYLSLSLFSAHTLLSRSKVFTLFHRFYSFSTVLIFVFLSSTWTCYFDHSSFSFSFLFFCFFIFFSSSLRLFLFILFYRVLVSFSFHLMFLFLVRFCITFSVVAVLSLSFFSLIFQLLLFCLSHSLYILFSLN